MRSSGLVGIYARDARIGETNHVCNVEDQGKHDNGDESAMSYDESALRIHNAICSIHDRLNLSKETKKRPSQRAGKTYSAVQNNLEGSIRSLIGKRECIAEHSPRIDRIGRS